MHCQIKIEVKKHPSTKIRIEEMTRAEFMGRPKRIVICYSIITVPAGRFLVASTHKGICFLMPASGQWDAVKQLKQAFPYASFRCRNTEKHRKAALLLKKQDHRVHKLTLHLYGTPFQLAVWNALLDIPAGQVTTYLTIAQRIDRPRAARPVGKAVGSNPVMYLIPCHRVILSNGKLGGYKWGIDRKVKLLNKEAHPNILNEDCTHWEPTLF